MFATPALAHSTYALMGPTMKKLEKMKTYADQVIQKKQISATVYCTTDRRDALKDADYVTSCSKWAVTQPIAMITKSRFNMAWIMH